MFHQTQTTRSPPKLPPTATEWSRLLLNDVIAASTFHSVATGGDWSAQSVFVPSDLNFDL